MIRLLVDRESGNEEHQTAKKCQVLGEFKTVGDKTLKAECKTRFKTEAETQSFMETCIRSSHSIKSLETKPAKKKPTAPFTTSTLQQEASRKLGFSVSRTMSVAQKLYEAGRITYMRTDSVTLSDSALDGAASAISASYGDEYCERRTFSNKSKGAQEAHEAIRPTDFSISQHGGNPEEDKLYSLIWKRSIASQMAEARLEKTTVTIDSSGSSELRLLYTSNAADDITSVDTGGRPHIKKKITNNNTTPTTQREPANA